MGIFSNRSTTNIDGIAVAEGYKFDNFGMYDIFMESMEDDMLVLESMCVYDMICLEADREVDDADEDEKEEAKDKKKVATEAAAKGTLTRIKEAIKKFFAKIMAWFKNIIDRVRSWGMDADKFVSTYESRIKAARLPNDGIKVQGYDFKVEALFAELDISSINSQGDIDNVGNDVTRIMSMSEAELDKEIEKYDGDEYSVNGIIGKKLGIGGNATDAEITKKLEENFFGDDGKKEITIRNVASYPKQLKRVTKAVNSLNKSKDKITSATNKLVTAIEKAEKNVANDKANEADDLLSKKLSAINSATRFAKNNESAYIRLANAQISAIGTYVSFAKSVCLKAIKGVKA